MHVSLDPIRFRRTALATLALVLVGLMPPSAEAQKRRVETASNASRDLRDCPVCPTLVTIPAGEFMMGSPNGERGRGKDEGPQRKVIIQKPFAAGKFEVTFAEWDACVAADGCKHKPGDESWGRMKRPVINVAYDDAQEYVAWLSKKTGKSYRLLTEAEWEYAARGVTDATKASLPFSTGMTINYKQANYDANFTYGSGTMGIYRQKTTDVGSFAGNAFGLHDMHGNVWEWVQDCYKPSYASAPTDGSAVVSNSCDLRILRGGAWNYQPQLLRSAYRYATAGNVRLENIGFRVARTL
jgi:formylglycine-generating enzyme required for sulfatase activity